MNDQNPQITIIIVNYKVKEYVANLLDSIKKSQGYLRIQIIVVDNNSADGSVSYLKQLYPQITYIENEENVGFGRANNQALELADGEYTLLINPDTIVSENCLQVMKEYMDETPECAASGCKILNSDGTLAPESRRSVPTISSSIYKVLGLTYLFPNNRHFGKYYMSFLPEDEVNKIPVLYGSFMFFRTHVLKELGGFDERFFMYAEDIDLCYRVNQKGMEIHYVPYTSVVHYKGESSKKDNINYIKNFNNSLYLFFDKHYTHKYSLLFKVIIYLGIMLKKTIAYSINTINNVKQILFDVAVLNIALIIGYIVRFDYQVSEVFVWDNIDFLWINVILSVLYLFFLKVIGKNEPGNYLLSEKLKSLFLTYTGVVVITFFVRELAFSRFIFLLGFLLGLIFLVLTFIIRQNKSENLERREGRLIWKRIAIVGQGERTNTLIEKLRSKVDWEYDLAGLIITNSSNHNRENPEGIKAIGNINNIDNIVEDYNLDQLYFSLNDVTYDDLLFALSKIKDKNVTVKLIPYHMDFLLGKSHVEYLDNVPLIELDISYNTLINRLTKRTFDLMMSIPLYLLFLLPSLIESLARSDKSEYIKSYDLKGKPYSIKLKTPIYRNRFSNMSQLLRHIIAGNLSFVGAPIDHSSQLSGFSQRNGLTGLIQLNKTRIKTEEDKKRFDLHYLQNHSLGMDIDILVKSLVYGPGPLEYLKQIKKL